MNACAAQAAALFGVIKRSARSRARTRLSDQIRGSDHVGPVGLRSGHILRRLDRILIQHNLRGTVPVASAKPDLECPGLRGRNHMVRAVTVDEALEFDEELQQVFVGIRLALLAGRMLSRPAEFRAVG